MVHLIIKIFGGKTLALDVDYSDLIIDIKEKICDKTGIMPMHQSLMFQNRVLKDNLSLDFYNIRKDDILYLCFKSFLEKSSYNAQKIMAQNAIAYFLSRKEEEEEERKGRRRKKRQKISN